MNLVPGPDSLLTGEYAVRPADPAEYIAAAERAADTLDALADLAAARRERVQSANAPTLVPATTEERSGNKLRPVDWDDIVGQEKTKRLLARMTSVALSRETPLDHVLLIGPSGTGKTTFAHVIAHALGVKVYQLEAPVSADTLLELAQVMEDGDILFLDEVHQQAVGDRRGKSSNTQPEVLFSVMEDRTLPTGFGVVQFPHVTIMGATTDEGMLPDAFINRFPIRPVLDEYTEDDMTEIARRNAQALGLIVKVDIARRFAQASRGVPREINNFIRNSAMLTDRVITDDLASEVIFDLNGMTEDGLTRDMQGMLTFLLKSKRYVKANDEVRYQASVNNIATALGKSRDVKAIQLRVEPWLIKQAYVQVMHGGRALTDLGVMRALRLTRGD